MATMIAGTATFLSSCKKDNSAGVPSSTSTSQMSFGINSDNATTNFSALGGASSGAAAITWTSGMANISGFRLEATKKGFQIEIRSNNLTNVDLFAINPSLVGATIDTGVYTQIEVRVELSQSSNGTLPLTLKGNFTNSGGTVIPIELDFNDNAEIRAEASNVTIDSKTDITSIVTMHLNKLLAGVSANQLNNATLTNGTLIISSSSNTVIYNEIKNAITNCGDDDGFVRHDKGNDGNGNNNGGNGNNNGSNSGSNGSGSNGSGG